MDVLVFDKQASVSYVKWCHVFTEIKNLWCPTRVYIRASPFVDIYKWQCTSPSYHQQFRFADARNLLCSRKNLQLNATLNKGLALLYDWLCANCLSVPTPHPTPTPTPTPWAQLRYMAHLKASSHEIIRIIKDKLSWLYPQ